MDSGQLVSEGSKSVVKRGVREVTVIGRRGRRGRPRLEEGILTSVECNIARLRVLGFTNREVAERLNISMGKINSCIWKPAFKQYEEQLKCQLDSAVRKAHNILVDASPEAANTLISVMRNRKNLRLKKEASVDILKGTGVLKGDERPSLSVNISDSQMQLLIETARVIERDKGEVFQESGSVS